MTTSTFLEAFERHAQALVAEQLKSSAAVISRLTELIHEALRLGHSHSAIYARLKAAGVKTSWNSYRSSLARSRKKARPAALGHPATAGISGPLVSSPVAHPLHVQFRSTDSSATHALESLRQARQTASKDYSRVTQGHLRQGPP